MVCRDTVGHNNIDGLGIHYQWARIKSGSGMLMGSVVMM